MSDPGRLGVIKAQRVALADDHTCLNLDWLPSIDWLVGEVENTDNRIENMAAKLDNQRAENARLNQQANDLKAEVRRRQAWVAPKEVARLRDLLARLEWAGVDDSCPDCWSVEGSGHDPGCELAATLRNDSGDG